MSWTIKDENSEEYELKTRQVQWKVEEYRIDEYGLRIFGETLSSKIFPNKKLAEKAMKETPNYVEVAGGVRQKIIDKTNINNTIERYEIAVVYHEEEDENNWQ